MSILIKNSLKEAQRTMENFVCDPATEEAIERVEQILLLS